MDTAPIRPQPEPRCTNEKCPIKRPHAQGYLHNQGLLPVGRAILEFENPPEIVLALMDKFDDNTLTEQESETVKALYLEHLDPCLENGLLMSLTKQTQCLDPGCPIEEPHGEGLYFHDRQNWLKTEKFRFCNPPPEIWEAGHRIEHGWNTQEGLAHDRDVVDNFVALHGDESMTCMLVQVFKARFSHR